MTETAMLGGRTRVLVKSKGGNRTLFEDNSFSSLELEEPEWVSDETVRRGSRENVCACAFASCTAVQLCTRRRVLT